MQGTRELTLYAQTFGEAKNFSAEGATAADALRNGEAAQGRRIFIGHTELLCIDGTRTLTDVRELLAERGLSPACKLLYTDVDACFQKTDTAELLESLRMAERRGLIAPTDITTVLDEWLGESETALMPAISESGLCMVLLHTNGRRTTLSEDAANGMFWLRRNEGKDFTMTVDTPEGVQDVTILRSSLQKNGLLRDGDPLLQYSVTVHAEDCPQSARRPLQEQILRQCRAAIAEMLKADADVIGLQELAAFSRLDEREQRIGVDVTVQ